MSIKDVKTYYSAAEQQFYAMNQTAKELNEECKKGNIPQAMVDQAYAMTLPLRQNYERLSYLLYLLNQPNRDKKKPKYKKQNTPLENALGSVPEIEAKENEDALRNFKEYVKYLKEEYNDTEGNN